MKAKRTKAPQRRTALSQLAMRLRTALQREITNVIDIGELLIESRKHLDHGEWQPWLAKNFDLSYRTALNYVRAAEYVARKDKSETVSHFTHSSSVVLYGLAAGRYDEREEAAILDAARKGRVNQDTAGAICDVLAGADAIRERLAPPDDGVVGTADHAEKAPPDLEIEAILDGPPPAVPPPAPIPPPPDFALRDFDQAVSTLKRLMTKSSAQFDDTIHSGNDLESVASFIRAVMKAKAAAANGCMRDASDSSK